MKKRALALVSTVLLVACMSLTALAAPSKEATTVVTGIEKVTDKNDKDITAKIVIEDIGTQYPDEIAYIKNADNMKKELGNAYKDGMGIIDIKNVKVVGDAAEIDWAAEIVFTTTEAVTSATEVVILHYTGSAWEVIDAKAGNKTITATFDSLSPVVFVAKGLKSPTTGEPVMLMSAIAAVAVGATGIAASKKRR